MANPTPYTKPRIIVIDDLREFPGINAKYIRTLPRAMSWLRNWAAKERFKPIELWLDHDLGSHDIRPFVDALDDLFYHHAERIELVTVKICSDDPVGIRYIRSAMSRYMTVEHVSENWRIIPSMIGKV